MTQQQKRAALFEYFQEVNNPKWASNGKKLFDTLQGVKDEKVNEMYDKMLELKKRAAEHKARMDKLNGPRPWKMLAIQFGYCAAASLYFLLSSNPEHLMSTVFAFFAGVFFYMLLDTVVHNLVAKKGR